MSVERYEAEREQRLRETNGKECRIRETIKE